MNKTPAGVARAQTGREARIYRASPETDKLFGEAAARRLNKRAAICAKKRPRLNPHMIAKDIVARGSD